MDHPATAEGDGAEEAYDRQNLAGYEIEDDWEDDDELVDMEVRMGEGEKNAVKEKMEDYIHLF